MEGTSKTPHSQAEAYILSQQSSVRIVQVHTIQVGKRCFQHLNACTCAFSP